jgi:hypothetical protein
VPTKHTDLSEIKDLIAEHKRLLKEYNSVLKKFPGPIPDSLTHVVDTSSGHRIVAVEPGNPLPKALPDNQSMEAEERETIRRDLLSIHLPNNPAYRPSPGEKPSAAQQAAIEWCNHMDAVMKRLRHYFRHRKEDLAEFSLANWGTGFGPSMNCQYILQALARHLELLQEEDRDLKNQKNTEERGGRETPTARLRRLLRQAIDKAELDNGAAAKEMFVSRDTLEDFLNNKTNPQRRTAEKFEKFIKKYLG